MNHKESNPNFAWIWKVDSPPKIKIFLWQLYLQALRVREELRRRGMQIRHLCPLCEEEGETIEHLFNNCTRATQVWEKARELEWVREIPQRQITEWLKNIKSNGGREEEGE